MSAKNGTICQEQSRLFWDTYRHDHHIHDYHNNEKEWTIHEYLMASEKYLAPYLSFKLSVRDKTPNWWIFPNTNLEHKYFEKLKKFCYLGKFWVFRSFTPWWKMILGVSNLPKFKTFFIYYYHKMVYLFISWVSTIFYMSWRLEQLNVQNVYLQPTEGICYK